MLCGSLLFRLVVACLTLWLLLVPRALAAGGDYDFDGGTTAQRAQVRAALEASSFDWGILPERVTVHIAPGAQSRSLPGHVWLDGDLLRTGRFAWAVVQDEFAHQVDFALLDGAARERLNGLLGGTAWGRDSAPGLAHGAYGSERFASTLVWAYWPSKDNAYRPRSRSDESAAMAPARFRALLGDLVGAPAPRALARARRP